MMSKDFSRVPIPSYVGLGEDTGTSPHLSAINKQGQRETLITAVVKTHTHLHTCHLISCANNPFGPKSNSSVST